MIAQLSGGTGCAVINKLNQIYIEKVTKVFQKLFFSERERWNPASFSTNPLTVRFQHQTLTEIWWIPNVLFLFMIFCSRIPCARLEETCFGAKIIAVGQLICWKSPIVNKPDINNAKRNCYRCLLCSRCEFYFHKTVLLVYFRQWAYSCRFTFGFIFWKYSEWENVYDTVTVGKLSNFSPASFCDALPLNVRQDGRSSKLRGLHEDMHKVIARLALASALEILIFFQERLGNIFLQLSFITAILFNERIRRCDSCGYSICVHSVLDQEEKYL